VADAESRQQPARLTDLRQVRAIANPLRIRMLQLFAQGPLTTKQVADRLGEKPSRLYNHARALERAGLVRLVRTAQNRGTTERYLEAVAPGFEVDESLFAMARSGSSARAAAYAMASGLLRDTAARLEAITGAPEPLVGQAAVVVTPREYERLRARVHRWIEDLGRRKPRRGRHEKTAEALLTVALLPPGSATGAVPDSRSPAGRTGKKDSRAGPRSGGRPPR
jgi:DNA-binding transcriptional ArsR family regulator